MPIHALDANVPDPVVSFLDSVVSSRGRAHWSWKYQGATPEAPCGYYWQEGDGAVLGFIGLMRTTLYATGARYPAAWFVDWHVIPGERGVGVGLGLLRKAEAAVGTVLTLQGSASTRQILPRLKWQQLQRPVTWARPLSSHFARSLAARRLPAPLRPLARLAGLLASSFRCVEPGPHRAAQLEDVDRLLASYDAVWEARAPEFAPAMRRDSSYLNYLCADYPDGGYRLQLLKCGAEVLGHLVSRLDLDRHGLRRGRIVDLLWPRQDTQLLHWLVDMACWQLQAAAADYIECLISVPDLAAAAQRARFQPRKPVAVWYHRLPTGVAPPDEWYLTLLDCDRAYR